MDGCGELRTFWSVVMPLCGPALGTLGLITFINAWNNFVGPLVVMRSVEHYTVPLALRSMQSPNNTEWGALMAGAPSRCCRCSSPSSSPPAASSRASPPAPCAANSRRFHELLTVSLPHACRPASRSAPPPAPRRSRAHAPDDGKGPSIWDAFCATPGKIKDGSNIDVACDHLHRMPRGRRAHARGWGWTPTASRSRGRACSRWGRARGTRRGFAFYDRLIDTLLAAGIAPHATLHHWDLPQALQESVGGWQSRETAQHFADYAAEIARRFGDRLVAISTLNEPWCVATLGYETRPVRAGPEEPHGGDAGVAPPAAGPRPGDAGDARAWRGHAAAASAWASC